MPPEGIIKNLDSNWKYLHVYFHSSSQYWFWPLVVDYVVISGHRHHDDTTTSTIAKVFALKITSFYTSHVWTLPSYYHWPLVVDHVVKSGHQQRDQHHHWRIRFKKDAFWHPHVWTLLRYPYWPLVVDHVVRSGHQYHNRHHHQLVLDEKWCLLIPKCTGNSTKVLLLTSRGRPCGQEWSSGHFY